MGVTQHRGDSRDDVQRLAARDHPLQLRELFLEPIHVDRRTRSTQDLRMRGRPDRLAVRPQLLVQLLSRPHADERDRDLGVGLFPGQSDHVAREIQDLHRLAHVEHVDLPAASDCACLHDQRDSLRNRHEVARHLRMGDRDRPALLDLAPEDRDHAAGGVQDVAEANGHEPRPHVVAMPVGLDDPFAQGLRLAEQVLRIGRLVCRDEDEPRGAVLHGDVGHDTGRKRVVTDSLERVGLQERDVLVRRGVEDDGGAISLEDLAHLRPVAAVAEHRRHS